MEREWCGFVKRGLRLGCLHARGIEGDGLKLGEASAGRDGDGGESVESQEGEFGAEVSAFLSRCCMRVGSTCMWVSTLTCARARAWIVRSCAR